MTTLASALGQAIQALETSGNLEARLEAEVLAMHQLGLSRAQLYSRWAEPLDDAAQRTYDLLVSRREGGEPLAYITGHKEFFGLDFLVDRRVLIPRPETELLVERALEWMHTLPTRSDGDRPVLSSSLAPLQVIASEAKQSHAWRGGIATARRGGPRNDISFSAFDRTSLEFEVADVGTGSGAIALSLAVHCAKARVYGIDISDEALQVARGNAARHQMEDRVTFLKGDLLTPLPAPVDLLVANLPYVQEALLPCWCGTTQVELAWEPQVALDGGPDGLALVRRFLAQAPGYLRPGGAVFLEIAWDQGSQALDLVQRAFPDAQVSLHEDLAGLDRMVQVLT